MESFSFFCLLFQLFLIYFETFFVLLSKFIISHVLARFPSSKIRLCCCICHTSLRSFPNKPSILSWQILSFIRVNSFDGFSYNCLFTSHELTLLPYRNLASFKKIRRQILVKTPGYYRRKHLVEYRIPSPSLSKFRFRYSQLRFFVISIKSVFVLQLPYCYKSLLFLD
jgi:hypothetical protein